ncbi:MAG: hypothetical protein IJY40_10995 [Oscillospiraceae bacterium]|nr:hypothetical protein [Oscillospiraceae bacterium]
MKERMVSAVISSSGFAGNSHIIPEQGKNYKGGPASAEVESCKNKPELQSFFIVSFEILYHYPKTQVFQRFSYAFALPRTLVRQAQT